MDYYVICIAVEGAQDRVSWGWFLAEPDGCTEEGTGVASSPLRAMLWGLADALARIPAESQVAIRTTRLREHNVGARKAERWRTQGLEDHPDRELCEVLLRQSDRLRILWFDASQVPMEGDRQARERARAALKNMGISFSPAEIRHILAEHRAEPLEQPAAEKLPASEPPSMAEPEREGPEDGDEPGEEAPEPPSMAEPEREGLEEGDGPEEEAAEPAGGDPAPPLLPQEPAGAEPREGAEEKGDEQRTEPLEPEPRRARKPRKKTESSGTDPSGKKKLGKAGEHRDPPPPSVMELQPAPEFLFGARLVAYVEGRGTGSLGAWAFVLVDRQTGSALLRAEGMRATTPARMRLAACISALQALRTDGQSIELRSRTKNLVHLGQRWMADWEKRGWTRKGGAPVEDLAFVQQLSGLCARHRVQWRHASEGGGPGQQEAAKLARYALDALNAGEDAWVERRVRDYPLGPLG